MKGLQARSFGPGLERRRTSRSTSPAARNGPQITPTWLSEPQRGARWISRGDIRGDGAEGEPGQQETAEIGFRRQHGRRDDPGDVPWLEPEGGDADEEQAGDDQRTQQPGFRFSGSNGIPAPAAEAQIGYP
ncbi:MAG: hypothetical protein WCE68_03115 [Anaerolineales bacterium]